MNINIYPNSQDLGQAAAAHTAQKLEEAIASKGFAYLVLSTGASQLATVEALVHSAVQWDKVEMFHLDEYVGLPITHKASFRRYLQERFVSKLPLRAAHWVTDQVDCIPELTAAISRAQVDVALIGIGENAHIAFNDPPADFEDESAFKVVTLDEACKQQQVREGWFASTAEVPREAISMTVRQILRARTIISCVPFAVKAPAIKRSLLSPTADPMVPASILKTHADFHLYVDLESWNHLDPAQVVPLNQQTPSVNFH